MIKGIPWQEMRGRAHLRSDPAACSLTRKSTQDLCRATQGSAGLDLSSFIYTVLSPETEIQAFHTGVYGSLPEGTVGLLLGRSSTTMQRILVAPGVIGADFEGEIKVTTYFPNGVSVVETGQRLAQLILLPAVQTRNQDKEERKGWI